MRSISKKIQIWYMENPVTDLLPYLALAFIGYAFYNPALRFVPVDYDDLILLSAAKNISNPFLFFIQDWGMGNFGFRPLHSLSLWLGYQLFGVSSGPNQLLNIFLHIAIILLLYSFLRRMPTDSALAFLFSVMSLVSFYTFSPPIWVSDRPTLLVAFFLLITLNHFARLDEKSKPNLPLIAVLSTLALLSKESGLIVPLVSIIFLVLRYSFTKENILRLSAIALVILIYLGVRFTIFGFSAGVYDEAGYLFGVNYYENSSILTGASRILVKADNVLKNMIAIFLPIFNGQGRISLAGAWTNSLVLVVTTVCLSLLAFSKKMGVYQKLGLALIVLNALVHFQVFRYRILYLGQIGFCIFLASSIKFSMDQKGKKLLALCIAAVLIFWNMHIIGEDMHYMIQDRIETIQDFGFEESILASSNRIDPEVVSRIIGKYRH